MKLKILVTVYPLVLVSFLQIFKKENKIIATINVVKKTSKFVQIGAGV